MGGELLFCVVLQTLIIIPIVIKTTISVIPTPACKGELSTEVGRMYKLNNEIHVYLNYAFIRLYNV